MSPKKEIWVIPEINGKAEEISKLSRGLLSEARDIADKVDGTVRALLFGVDGDDCSDVLMQYGVDGAYIYKHPLLANYSIEAYFKTLAETLEDTQPWIIILGDTLSGKELAPKLALFLKTGMISTCVKMDFGEFGKPKFYRAIYDEQVYQELEFRVDKTMIVTMDSKLLNINSRIMNTQLDKIVIEPLLTDSDIKIKHLEYLQVYFKSVDVADAGVIVSAGMGAATVELLPLVEELANLLEGTLGTTRPVVDEGIISRERMIGQTGKTVSPELYLALGISGATHHIGGIQESKTIVSINRDAQASIFQTSDTGIIADLKEILPALIRKIKQEKKDGKIL